MNFLCNCILSGHLCRPCESLADYGAWLLGDAGVARLVRTLLLEGKLERAGVKQLIHCLQEYPQLAYVYMVDRATFDVYLHRADLVECLRVNGSNFVFTSVERGLKHAGFVVAQTSHAGIPKIWRYVGH